MTTNITKNTNSNACTHCEGRGFIQHDTWLNKHPEGMCFRCHGSGVEPGQKRKNFVLPPKEEKKVSRPIVEKMDWIAQEVNGLVVYMKYHQSRYLFCIEGKHDSNVCAEVQMALNKDPRGYGMSAVKVVTSTNSTGIVWTKWSCSDTCD